MTRTDSEDASRLRGVASTLATGAVEVAVAAVLLGWVASWLLVAYINVQYGDYVAASVSLATMAVPAVAYQYYRLSAYLPLPTPSKPEPSLDVPTPSLG
ncbi:hypothetical protein [Halobaculum sp. D14]|uniref:hypothetical protein n=1 Tax=unclassified Halobaculum TaxID=2640896 RepID=UPI003EC0E3BE